MYRPATFDPPWMDFFTSPCPCYMKRHNTFPQFPELPIELQLMIWDQVEPDPQYIVISSVRHEYPNGNYRAREPLLGYKTPGILQACYNSRVVGLKWYNSEFAQQLGHPIYFNFTKDFLHFADFEALLSFSHTNFNYRMDILGCMDYVQNLMLEVPYYLKARHIFEICANFTTVKKIYIQEPNPVFGDLPTGLLKTFHPSVFPTQWQNAIGSITRSIGVTRVRQITASAWDPPEVTIGYMSQYEADWRRKQEIEDRMEWEYSFEVPSLKYVQYPPKKIWKSASGYKGWDDCEYLEGFGGLVL